MVVADDELRKLLERTKEHNTNTDRLSMAECLALPNPRDARLAEILRDTGTPDRGTLERYIREVGNDRAPVLIQRLVAQERVNLSNPTMIGVVAKVWTLAEPFQSSLIAGDWIAMFRVNGYTDEGRQALRPTGTVTVYRGTVAPRRVGMSWTTNFATAKEFACDRMSNRCRGNIYRAEIPSTHLLAYIHDELGRGEYEYVVDQNQLDPHAIELVARGEDLCD